MPRNRVTASTASPMVHSNRAKISFQQKEFGSMQHLCMASYSGDLLSTQKLLATMKNIVDKNPLRLAAEAGHQEIITALLTHPDMHVNIKFTNDFTALHCAASKGHANICKYLIDINADVTMTSTQRDTPLHIACLNDQIEVVKTLLAQDASLLAKNNKGELPFHSAVRSGKLGVLDLLLDDTDEFLKLKNNEGSQAIHIAAQAASAEIVEFLLERKADPSVMNKAGNNALHESILHRNIENCKVLQASGMSLTELTRDGDSVIHLSVIGDKDEPQMLEYLLPQSSHNVDSLNAQCLSPLFMACQTANIKIVQSLLEHKADVFYQGDESTLFTACIHQQTQIVKLIANPALCNQPNEHGVLPIHIAAELGSQEILGFLLSLQPAQLNVQTKFDLKTPLYIACEHMRTTLVWYLLEKGADYKISDSEGNTVLHLACNTGQFSIVKRLFEIGADFSLKNNEGLVPFELVTSSKVASFLVQQEIPGGPGITCLDLSKRNLASLPENEEFWKSFEKMTTLNLSWNKLETIPISLLAAPKLVSVVVDHNPLGDIPPHYKKDGLLWKDIQSYLISLKENSTRWHDQKIVIIGEAGSGRKSLIAALETGKLVTTGSSKRSKIKTSQAACLRQPVDENEPEILIHANKSLMFPKKTLFSRNNATKLSATIWKIRSDIASCCPFFFTDQAVYLLVFDLVTIKEHITELDNWMQQIGSRTLTSLSSVDVLFIGTHKDNPQCTKEYIAQIRKLLMERYPSNRFPQFKGVFPISNKSGSGFDDLLDAIKESGNRSQPMINPTWLVVHQHLKELQNTTRCITWTEYKQIAQRCGAKEDQLLALTRFLCSTSTIMFCDNLSNSYRPSVIILDPIWIAKLISTLRSLDNVPLQCSISTLVSNLPEWKEYDHATQNTLLRIFQSNQIVFELPNQKVLCPWRLDVSPSIETLENNGWPRFPPVYCIQHGRIFDFTFIPIGFIERVLSSIGKLLLNIKLVYSSSYQLIFSYEDQIALISFIPRRIDQRAYQLQVQGRTPRETTEEPCLFIQLIGHIESIIESYYVQLKSTLQSWVVCSHCISSHLFQSNPFLFSYSRCVCAIIDDPNAFLYCREIHCKQRAIRIDVMAPDISLSTLQSRTIPDSKLSLVKHLGDGATGEVNLMKFDQSCELLAVKVLSTGKRDFIDEEDRTKVLVSQYNELTHEIRLMSTLNHPNIVQFRGICTRPLRVAMEFAPHGDLHQLIREQDPKTLQYTPIANRLTWEFRYRVALDIARGLQYLSQKNIIHRDVRSPNIFMVNLKPNQLMERVAVVADFGLSVYAMPQASGMLRTWRWLAPEVFHYSSTFYDCTSDIYSFGVVLWELIEGSFPFGEFTEDEWEIQEAIVKENLRPTIPQDNSVCHPSYRQLIEQCWSPLPHDRPDWGDIINTLLQFFDAPKVQMKMLNRCTTSGGEALEVTMRPKRFSSFSESTMPAKLRAQFELPEKVQKIVSIDGTLWLATREGLIMIYRGELSKGSLKNPEVIRKWNIHSSSIIEMFVIDSSMWCVAQDGILVELSKTAPFYESKWMHTPTTNVPVTSATSSTLQGKSLIWCAMLPTENSYLLRVWNTETYSSSEISFDEPADGDNGSRVSCIVDMCQYGDIMLIGSHHFVFIVNIEQQALVGYWQVYSNDRLQQILCVPLKQQVWTISGNLISVWNVTSDLDVSLLKELEGHSSKVTSACVFARKKKRKDGSYNLSSNVVMVWSCSFDGQVLVWDTDKLIGVHEVFLAKEDIPWEIQPVNSRYMVINSHHSTSIGDMVSRLVFCRTRDIEFFEPKPLFVSTPPFRSPRTKN